MKLLKFAFAKNNIFENKTKHKNFTVLLYLILVCSLLLGLTNALPIGKFGSLEVTYDNQNLFFKAQLNSLGYLGIGFTKDSHKMENTDMIIMIIGKDKSKENTYTCSVLDYYSEETYPVPDNELEPPGTNDIKNVKFTDEKKDEKTVFTVTFERALITNDKWDVNFQLDYFKQHLVAFAYKKDTGLDYHDGNVVNYEFYLGNDNKVEFGEDLPPIQFVFNLDFGEIEAIIKKESNKPDIIEFTLRTKTWGYFAIGLGSHDMTETDMIVVQINENSDKATGTVGDYYSKKKSNPPKLDTDLGGLNNIISSYFEFLNDKNQPYKYEIKFSRNLKTNDETYDFELKYGTTVPCSIVWSPKNPLSYHKTNKSIFNLIVPLEKYVSIEKAGNITFREIMVNLASFEKYTIQEDFASVTATLNGKRNKIGFFFELKDWGYVGIGFGKSMEKIDIIAVEVNEKGGFSVTDRYSFKKGYPMQDNELDGYDNILNPQILKTEKGYTVSFERLLTPDDALDFQMELKENKDYYADICFAWKAKSPFDFHDSSFKITNLYINPENHSVSFNKEHSSSDSPKPDDNDNGLNVSDFGRITAELVNDSIKFTVQMKDYGYIGIAFKENMQKADIIAIEVTKSNELKISDMYSTENSFPKTDISLGGKDNITDPKIDIAQMFLNNPNLYGRHPLYSNSADFPIKVTFTRKIDTGDEFDYKLLSLEDLQKNNKDSNGKQAFSVVWKEKWALSPHDSNVIKSQIAFSTEQGVVVVGSGKLPGAGSADEAGGIDFFELHGIFLICSWTFLSVPSIIAIRHFKHLPFTKYIHLGASGSVSIITIVFGAIAVDKNMPLDLNIDFDSGKSLHIFFGFFAFVLTAVQFIGGLFSFFTIYFYPQNNNKVHKFKLGHLVLGYFLSIISYLLFITGFNMLFKNYVFLTYIAAAFFPLLFIVFEIFFTVLLNRTWKGYLTVRAAYNKAYNSLPVLTSNEVDLLISNMKNSDLVNSNTKVNSKKEYDSENLLLNTDKNHKIVFYDNLVIDIGLFIDGHPGGNNNIIKHLGKDMGRFITGTYPANINFHAHKHSRQAEIELIKTYSIGKLNEDHGVAILNDATVYVNSIDTAILTNIDTIAKDTYKISFQVTDNKNNNIKFAKSLNGIGFFAKHFSVFSSTLNKTRFYTLCLALNPSTYNSHFKVLEHYLNKSRDSSLRNSSPEMDEIVRLSKNPNNLQLEESVPNNNNQNNDNDNNHIEGDDKKNDEKTNLNNKNNKIKGSNYQTHLDLYLKRYNESGSMSNFITNSINLNKKEEFSVNGPLGRGLGFNNKSVLTGSYVIISGGTGIFCFLDFILYTFRYMVHMISKTSDKGKRDSINEDDDCLGTLMSIEDKLNFNVFDQDDFSNVREDFRLVFYSSFHDQETAVFDDFCSKLQKLDDKHGFNIFKYLPRFSNKDKFRWNKAYLQESLSEETESLSSINKVFVCGPFKLVEELTSTLTELGVGEKVIDV